MTLKSDANYMKKMFLHRCNVTNPMIIIETALQAAIPTLVELNEYTCADIMKMAGAHTWGVAATLNKSLSAGKRRSSPRRRGACGRRMSGALKNPNSIAPHLVDDFKFMYEISGGAFVEGALFKFFLFELGKNFLINWMTLAYAAEHCSLPPAGTIYTSWDALFTPGPEREITCEIGPGSTHCASSSGHEIHVPPGCTASMSWAGRWVPFRNDPGLLGNVSMWIEDDTGKQFGRTDAKSYGTNNFINQAGGLYELPGRFPRGTEYRLKALIHGGLMGPADSPGRSLVINTNGKPVDFMPMGGCGKALGHLKDEVYGFLSDPLATLGNGEKVLNKWFTDIDKFLARPPPDVLL